MRKLKYLLAVAVMSTSLLFGCGSNDDTKNEDKAISTDEFIEKVENSDSEIKSGDFKINASIDAKADDEAIKGSVSVNASMDSNKNMKMDINLDAGESGQQTITSYLAADGDNYTMYMQIMGQWYKMDLEDMESAAGVASLPLDSASSSDINFKEVLSYIKDAEVTASGDTYKLSGTLDLKKAYDAIVSLAGDAAASMSDYEDQVNELIGKIKINVSLSINKDGQFKAFEVSVGKFEYEGLSINELKFSVSGDNYNGVADITIPDEAAAATDLSSMLNSVGGSSITDSDYDDDDFGFDDEDDDFGFDDEDDDFSFDDEDDDSDLDSEE